MGQKTRAAVLSKVLPNKEKVKLPSELRGNEMFAQLLTAHAGGEKRQSVGGGVE